jgi:hypothetical protein
MTFLSLRRYPPFVAPASAPTPTTTSYTHLHIRWLSE